MSMFIYRVNKGDDHGNRDCGCLPITSSIATNRSKQQNNQMINFER